MINEWQEYLYNVFQLGFAACTLPLLKGNSLGPTMFFFSRHPSASALPRGDSYTTRDSASTNPSVQTPNGQPAASVTSTPRADSSTDGPSTPRKNNLSPRNGGRGSPKSRQPKRLSTMARLSDLFATRSNKRAFSSGDPRPVARQNTLHPHNSVEIIDDHIGETISEHAKRLLLPSLVSLSDKYRCNVSHYTSSLIRSFSV